MCEAYATDANTRLLTAILGDSLQTNSAQRRREFGTLVMDMFVDGNSYVRKYRQCVSEDNGYFSLSTALQPRLFQFISSNSANQRDTGEQQY
jgi:hypothetical protein